MARAKYSKHNTPDAIFKYVYVDKPDTGRDGTQPPKYKIRGIIADTEENREWIKKVLETALAEAAKTGLKMKKKYSNPFNFPEDQDPEDYVVQEGYDRPKLDEDHQGAIFFQAKSNYAPLLVDSALQELPESVKIMPGDTGQIEFQGVPYEGLGSGVSLRLTAVQLLEKATGFSGGPSGFSAREGGYVVPSNTSAPNEDDEEF